MQPIRIAPTPSLADEWALVLTAAGIANRIDRDASGWVVLAPGEERERAHAALVAYDEEQHDRIPSRVVVLEPYPWMSGVALGLLVLWLFTVTGTPAPGSVWFERGAAIAGRLMAGELWRAVTALTLHVDLVHAGGNALAVAVLLPPIVQRFGGGGALWLLLLAGVVGNVAAAAIHDIRYTAVGASTAAFGAVGVLVALRFVPGDAATSGKRWTAPVAGVLLLAVLGTAPRADLAAHALGLVAGAACGLIAGVTLRRRPAPAYQWALGALAGLLVVAAWRVALGAWPKALG